ncbi:ABC transporter permease [Leucobacter luti]|uniref:Peptide/nickel transport system permease protein n=1 Tax=Leucobacter luti TaxID=340320 RepID=A0A4R6S7P5_9MICO|nr:ABC transporter permease [Leucobacter luti]QYM75176.1 ABC transporter permease [Leucobacter luti]TDP95433.1 peptide/nickel transport system permease protein [Leucobacter luti]
MTHTLSETGADATTSAPEKGGGNGYGRFILRRLGTSLITLFGITIVSFGLGVIVPLRPETANLSQQALANPEAVAAFREKFGLNLPIWEQYLRYLGGLVRGDLGISQQTGQPIAADLAKYAPATLELVVWATVLSVLIGVSLGIIAANARNRWPDQVARLISLLGVSLPTYWIALVGSTVFFRQLGWLPGSGRLDASVTPPPTVTGFYTIDALLVGDFAAWGSAISHLILPATVLALSNLGMVLRFTRSAVLDGLNTDAVKAARVKGLPSTRVLMRYAVRSASSPIITVTALSFGFLLAATVYVEQIFAWGGLGQYAYRSATNLDITAITGISVVIAVIFLAVNFLADILASAFDPRIRIQ